MSRQVVSDAEAKRLLKKLNRRMGAISLLTGGHFSWRAWLAASVPMVITFALVGWLYFSERKENWLLLVVVSALLTQMEFYAARVNQRIDAVVELLRQGGLLENRIPPDNVGEV